MRATENLQKPGPNFKAGTPGFSVKLKAGDENSTRNGHKAPGNSGREWEAMEGKRGLSTLYFPPSRPLSLFGNSFYFATQQNFIAF